MVGTMSNWQPEYYLLLLNFKFVKLLDIVCLSKKENSRKVGTMSNWQPEYPHPPPAGPFVKCNHVICTPHPTLLDSFACTDRHGHIINLQLLERTFIRK